MEEILQLAAYYEFGDYFDYDDEEIDDWDYFVDRIEASHKSLRALNSKNDEFVRLNEFPKKAWNGKKNQTLIRNLQREIVRKEDELFDFFRFLFDSEENQLPEIS